MKIRGYDIEPKRAWLVGAAILLLLGSLWVGIGKKHLSEVPRKPDVEQKQEKQWYVRFSVRNQKATAYVDSARGQLASSGKVCHIGGVAVHPLRPGIDPRNPIIPFDTIIYLDEPLEVQGRTMSAFSVIDTGDVVYGRYGGTPYWFDIYWGQSNYYNVKAASEFGIQNVSYHWYEPWR